MNAFNLAALLTLDKSDYDKGLDEAKKGADDFGKSWGDVKGKATSGAKSIAVGAGALAGLGTAAFKAADSLSKNMDEIDKTSQKVGLSAKAYQEWDYVLKISGTEMSNMTTGLKTLTNKFDEARNGSKGAVDMFKKLGLSMEDIGDLSREDLFSTVITAFQGMEDSAERAALANDLFGKSGQDLTPLFNTTAEETQALIEQVNELGGVMSDDMVKDGAAFQDSLTGVKTAFAGASASLVGELVPAITNLMDKISQFVADGGLEKIINLLKILAPVITTVVVAFAGFKIVSGIISLIKAASTAFALLNTVMLANPIGLIIAAIAALVAAFVMLWNNCEEFREFWINLWQSISDFFIGLWEGIKNVVNTVVEWIKENWQAMLLFMINPVAGVFKYLYDHFDGFRQTVDSVVSAVQSFFTNLWDNITQVFSNVDGWFKEKFEAAKEAVINAWSNIKEKAAEIWENLKSGFTIEDALTWGKDMIQNFISGITEKWEALKESLRNIGQSIKDFIGFSEPKLGPLSDFHTYAPDMMELFAKGIRDNEHVVTDQIAKSFDFADMEMTPAVNPGGAGGAGAASGRFTIGFDPDPSGLVRYLHPYIKDEDARVGGVMVVG